MPMMRRAQYDRYGAPDVLYVGQASVPEPRPGEVLVRVHAASVNGGELVGRAGTLRWITPGPFPRGTGIDFAGEVARVNGAATGLAEGDRVWGILPTRQYATGRGGSAAEYVAVPAELVAHSPAGLDLVQAAALPAVGTTAITAVHKVGLRTGERLLVRGATGGVGSIVVQLAHALGAQVTGLASAANLDLVRELGADRALDYTAVGPTDLDTFDVVLDTVGSQLSAYRRLLTRGGRMLTITPDANHLLRSTGSLIASAVHGPRRVRFFRGSPQRELFTRLTTHVDDGNIRPVIDTIHPLASIAHAHRAMEAGGSRGKHVIQLR